MTVFYELHGEISVTHLGVAGYKACVTNRPEISETGQTSDEAIGNLVSRHSNQLVQLAARPQEQSQLS